VDLSHRDRILAEAALVARHMEPAQVQDPAHWFETEDEADTDFPSGRAVNTATVGGTCVFLDSRRYCVLQLAEAASPGLKPFFCRAYPIGINGARVIHEADWCPSETQCCGPVDEGELTALDVYRPELTHLLGEAGVKELRRIAVQRARSESAPA
jgi:hypothetical protein